MKYCAVLIVLLLAGCGDYLTKSEIDSANALCKDNGGLKYVYESVTFGPEIWCNNGAKFNSWTFDPK